jgi:hypothetical protein
MRTDFYTLVFCGTEHVLVLICLDQKINTITFDLRDDFKSCLSDFLNQCIQDSESIHKVTYGNGYYFN